MVFERPLTGAELVLVAQVPGAGDRWHQVHFNAALVEQFFRLGPGHMAVRLQRVDSDGTSREPEDRTLVFSQRNKNYKIEFDFPVTEYPEAGPPLLLILEVAVRVYRYQLLLPGQEGYEEMTALNLSEPSVGRGLRRILTTLDEVELRWPRCKLRPRPDPIEAARALRRDQEEGPDALREDPGNSP